MKFIKICSIFVTVAAFIISLTVSAFADAVNGISVSSDSVAQGEEFTVILSVPPSENADTASIKVKYDNDAFEVVEWIPEISGSVSNGSNGVLALSAANIERAIDLSNGLTLTAKLKVRDDAVVGEYTFDLTDNSICYVKDNGYEFEELWFPEITKVAVIVSSAETNTSDTVNHADLTDNTPNEDKSSKTAIIIIVAVILTVIVVIACIGTAKHRK